MAFAGLLQRRVSEGGEGGKGLRMRAVQQFMERRMRSAALDFGKTEASEAEEARLLRIGGERRLEGIGEQRALALGQAGRVDHDCARKMTQPDVPGDGRNEALVEGELRILLSKALAGQTAGIGVDRDQRRRGRNRKAPAARNMDLGLGQRCPDLGGALGVVAQAHGRALAEVRGKAGGEAGSVHEDCGLWMEGGQAGNGARTPGEKAGGTVYGLFQAGEARALAALGATGNTQSKGGALGKSGRAGGIGQKSVCGTRWQGDKGPRHGRHLGADAPDDLVPGF